MADPVTATVALAPVVDLVRPYADVITDGVVTGVFVLIAPLAKKYLGQKLVDLFEAKVEAWAETEAHAAIAAAEDNLAKRAITVSDPIVVQAAQRIEAGMPPLLKAFGWTPARLQVLVAAAIGKLQIKLATAPAPSLAPAAK